MNTHNEMIEKLAEPTEQEYLAHAEAEELLLFASEDDYLAIANGVWELFVKRAQALQSSEPVAKYKASVGGFSPHKWVTHQEKHSGNLGEGYLPLFTYPPASVPLEKYNKLLQAMKHIEFATKPEPDDGSYHENAYTLASQAIAEAEGVDG